MASTGREDTLERRVLVATDESELGEQARRWAGRCARKLGVTLVTLQGISATATETLTETLAPVRPIDLLVVGLADHQGRIPNAAVDLVAAAPCLTVLMRADGGNPRETVTAAVSGDQSDEAVLAAAVDIAAICHAEVRLLHTRPLPLRRSDSPDERWAGQIVLESARRQILRLSPNCTPSTQLLRLQAQEAVCHHCGTGLLVVGARRSSRPGLGLVTRTALYHARSPVAVVHATHPAAERKRTLKASELSLL
ncbi:MAG: universal stress protein [Pseudonocardiaceae bacterium]